MKATTIVALCATFAVAGCESERQPEAKPTEAVADEEAPTSKAAQMAEDPLNGTAWVLEALPGRALVPETTVFVSFEEGRVSGSDGCNRFRTGYTLDGSQLEIDPSGASTLAACPPPIMEQAAAFMKALSGARAAKLDGTTLSLTDESGTTRATFTAQPKSLADTSWQVLSVNNGKGGVTGVRKGTSLTLDFGADGKLSGSGGCNRFRSTYETEGDTVTIGPAAATRRMCPEPVMEQEDAFLKALTGTLTTRFEGDRIELRTDAGSLMLSAKRVDGS